MTTSQPDRLGQVEQTLQQIVAAQQTNTAGIASLLAIAQLHQQSIDTQQQNFNKLVQEIRGIRTELRRINVHLFGEQVDD